MKIVFFGSSDFAVPFLDALKAREEVALIVTQPDRKSGRDLKVLPTLVKQEALRLGMKILQPVNVNSNEIISQLTEIKPDLFIVVSFGQILSRGILGIPRIYSINSHASLLPKYRGAAPVNWAIASGEKETGVTIMKMNEKMDQGEIILQKKVEIDRNDDAVMLSKKLSQAGSRLMLDTVDLIKKGAVVLREQDDSLATYAPKLKKEDGAIDWNLGAEEIASRVRAFVPWPGCFTRIDGRMLKIWKAVAERGSLAPGIAAGTIIETGKDGIIVAAGKGVLRIKELQPESSRRMGAGEFIIGHKNLAPGIVLSN